MKNLKYFLPLCLGALFYINEAESANTNLQGFATSIGGFVGNIVKGAVGNAAVNAGVATLQQVENARMLAENAKNYWNQYKNDINMRQHYAQSYFSSAENYLKTAEAYHNHINMTQQNNPTKIMNAQNYVNSANVLVIEARNAATQAGLQLTTQQQVGVTATSYPAVVQPTVYQTTVPAQTAATTTGRGR